MFLAFWDDGFLSCHCLARRWKTGAVASERKGARRPPGSKPIQRSSSTPGRSRISAASTCRHRRPYRPCCAEGHDPGGVRRGHDPNTRQPKGCACVAWRAGGGLWLFSGCICLRLAEMAMHGTRADEGTWIAFSSSMSMYSLTWTFSHRRSSGHDVGWAAQSR